MTTGEGGVIVTDNEEWDTLFRSLRNQGRDVRDAWLNHTRLGYNYRLGEMSAALGVAQMTRLDDLLKKREQVAVWYTERLAEMPEVETPAVEPSTTRMSWFVYVARFDRHVDRDGLVKTLKARGVPARPYFSPIHLQPYMVERFGYRPGDFPVTEDLGARGLALPFSGVMSETQVEHVCQTLRAVLRGE